MTPPVFSHGALRLYLLALLDEQPRHGYELIQALSEQSGGTYAPSAGTIYPRLARLEQDGLVVKHTEGRKSTYTITDAGRAELESRRAELIDITQTLDDSVRRLAAGVRNEVRGAMRSLRAELASAARTARDEAIVTATTPTDATATIQRADIVLNEFRQDIRVALRNPHVRQHVTDATVESLRTALARVREDLRAALRD